MNWSLKGIYSFWERACAQLVLRNEDSQNIKVLSRQACQTLDTVALHLNQEGRQTPVVSTMLNNSAGLSMGL